MKLKKTLLLFVFKVLLCVNVIAQSSPFNISTQNRLLGFPAPEAAELGKYGQIPVSYFNGLPEVSIPVYTVQCKDLQVPISLTYHAGGNKPDDHPGWVGLGWSLNAGGMITRIINGVRDELTMGSEFQEETGSNITISSEIGYYYRAKDLNTSDWPTNLLNKIVGSDPSFQYLDTQPDEFIFNFCGHSGSFYFVDDNGDMKVKVKSKSGDILKVEPIFSENDSDVAAFDKSIHKLDLYKFKVFKTFSKFIITTIDGNKYEFGGSFNDIDFTMCSSLIAVASSWHLTKIVSPNGDYINFEYLNDGINYVQRKANYFYESSSDITGQKTDVCAVDRNDSNTDDGLSISIICPKYLKKIQTSANQIINFVTSKTTELDYDNWNTIGIYHKNVISTLLPNASWSADFLANNYYLKLDRIELLGVKNVNFFYSNNTNQRLRLLGMSQTSAGSVSSDLNSTLNINKYSFSYNSTALPKYNSRLTVSMR